jgi:hypothetical protein
LSISAERGLSERLSEVLPDGAFAFRGGELLMTDISALDEAFPLMRSVVEEVWTSEGKNLTSRYLSVYDTHEMRCPMCQQDSELDVEATISVRLTRQGTSIDDARDDSLSWNEESSCSCSCGWAGRVQQAKV